MRKRKEAQIDAIDVKFIESQRPNTKNMKNKKKMVKKARYAESRSGRKGGHNIDILCEEV